MRVTDGDQNLNPAVAETITAVITSSSGDSETITLTETGVNTGIFTACIPASATTVGTPNNGTLYAPQGSTLNVTYTDPNDPSDTSNDTAVVTTLTPAMAIAKTRIQPADGVAVIGETVRFDVVVSNPGPTTLTTVGVTDNFPSTCLSYVSASIPPTVGASTLTWSNTGRSQLAAVRRSRSTSRRLRPATRPPTRPASGTDQNGLSVSAGPVAPRSSRPSRP